MDSEKTRAPTVAEDIKQQASVMAAWQRENPGLASKPGKRRKKNQIGEPFVPILKHMIKSPAFKKLTNASRVAYMLLKMQCNDSGQREVIFPYGHAEAYMNRHTFSRSIKQLCDLGFIEKSDFGGLYRRTNVYRFIDKWRAAK